MTEQNIRYLTDMTDEGHQDMTDHRQKDGIYGRQEDMKGVKQLEITDDI